MSIAKRMMEEREALEGQATHILLEVGCLTRCPNHDDVLLENDNDLEPAYRLANTLISKGEIELPHGEGRRWFTDLIKSVFDDHLSDECYSCAKMMED
ncbi:hypothetical protein WH158_06835 [Gluconobacter cerinus]|uniref:hypothetical protein n=1 Tax=Gluconobacter cerinus TaxID=38307 RepID=UPI0030A26A0E